MPGHIRTYIPIFARRFLSSTGLAILLAETPFRDSPIGSDARFWSGRLGFESLSRS